MKDEKDDGEEEEGATDTVSSVCASCSLQNDKDAKHCKQCGTRLGGVPKDDEEEDPPPDSEKPAKAALPAASTASTEAMLGVPQGASAVAIRTAVIPLERLARYAMTLTGQSSIDGAMGGLKALAEEAAEVVGLRASLAKESRRNDYRERMGALRRLASAQLPGYARGDLLIDDEREGKLVTRPAPEYADMPLATLKAMVDRKIKGASSTGRTSAKRNPFEPDRASAEAKLAKGTVTAPDKQLAAQHGFDPERVAASRAALFGGNGTNNGAGVL